MRLNIDPRGKPILYIFFVYFDAIMQSLMSYVLYHDTCYVSDIVSHI